MALLGDGLGVSRVRPAYQQIADQLRELVLTGVLVEGDKFPNETDLALQFGVSRSTVREALRSLVSEQLVRTVRGPQGGTFVAASDLSAVSEFLETRLGLVSAETLSVEKLLEARDVLEVPAARLAARRRGEADLRAIEEAHAREVARRGRQDRFRGHRNFHTAVVEASGNPLLAVMNEPLFRVLSSRFLKPEVPDGMWDLVEHDHVTILAAIRDRDAAAAGDLMAQHLLALRGAYLD